MKIGNFEIGKEKVFIIAELSANHNGKIETAIETIKAAKQAGADCIKFQTYTPDTITIDSKNKDFKIKKNNSWSKYNNLFNLYKKAQTPFKWIPLIFRYCKKRKISVFASVFDISSLKILKKLNCPAYKIASPEITDIPLIEEVAKTKKPVIISTGLANLKDIELAYKTITKFNSNLVILKCTSSYPTKEKEVNLKTIFVDFHKIV